MIQSCILLCVFYRHHVLNVFYYTQDSVVSTLILAYWTHVVVADVMTHTAIFHVVSQVVEGITQRVNSCCLRRNKCSERRNAVFRPIPGSRDISFTAFSNSCDGYLSINFWLYYTWLSLIKISSELAQFKPSHLFLFEFFLEHWQSSAFLCQFIHW